MPNQHYEQHKRDFENHILGAHEHKAKLLSDMNGLYPRIEEGSNLDIYLKGDLHHASIHISAPQDTMIKFLTTALTRAKNVNSPAHSRHGFGKHGEIYNEAIDAVIPAVESGEFTVRKEHSLKLFGIKPRTIEHFLLETKKFNRITYLPGPLATANAMAGNDIKNARNFAIDPTHGYGFALMYLIYKGYDQNGIKKALSDAQWLNNPRGTLHGTLLRLGNIQTPYIIEKTRAKLVIDEKPNVDPEKYKETLSVLHKDGLDVPRPEDLLTSPNGIAFQFAEVKQLVQPMIVFSGAVEQAELQSDKKFGDPIRYDTIHKKFEDVITSMVITAFLKVIR